MSIFTKIAIVIFPIIIYIILRLIFKLLKIHHSKKIKISDVLFIFLIFGLNSFMKIARETSLLPYYLMLTSGIALVLLLIDLFYYERFVFPIFFRHFWRVTSLVTFIMYFTLIILFLFF
ncbi:MAG: DUF3397 family protein [Lactovum sp.]